jgi:S-adenosylmethionine:tRNA ribosyltransferase-isomerase
MGPDAFDYALPADRIAQQPAERRADARMLVLRDALEHARVGELPRYLPADALVVVNASRVVPARLHATRSDGRTFELLLTAPAPGQGPGTQIAAWVRGARRLAPGDVLQIGDALELRYVEPDAIDERARWFVVEHGEVLPTTAALGTVPLPPYIERPHGPDLRDRERYQTLFAAHEGSVAAPTAGLHLDEALLATVDHVAITLHVGPGTFLPMDVDDVVHHRVGHERYAIDPEAATRIQAARDQGRPIVAVGTTVTRTLEAAAGGGARIEPRTSTTDLVIRPGHRFSVVTHLLTNFHLPRSSLLMLVCSFGGRQRVLDAYAQAIDHGYRFYSYGDSMLVTRETIS